MIAYGVPMADLHTIANKVDARLFEADVRGKGVKFTLRPTGDKFRKVNPISGRRIFAICWHGHYEFFAELFRAFPEARVKTQNATYNGAQEFAEKAEDTDTSVGPMGNVYGSFNQSDCCKCSEE